jgi:hypothetical protein
LLNAHPGKHNTDKIKKDKKSSTVLFNKKWTSIQIIFKVHHQTNAGPWV